MASRYVADVVSLCICWRNRNRGELSGADSINGIIRIRGRCYTGPDSRILRWLSIVRSFVFTGARTTLKQQIAAFGGVNLVAAGAVICVAISLHLLLLAAGIPDFHAQWIAHAAGLATGAPLNFSGHFLLTFRSRRA